MMFKALAHLVMIQRKSANPYARKTEKGLRPGGATASGSAVKAPVYTSSSQPHLNSVPVLVEMFKAHLVMIQRKSANPYARF